MGCDLSLQCRAIQVKFYATGFINSVFHFGAARRYGNQVRENTLGTVHTHTAHYKVDLDVGGKTPQAGTDCSEGPERLGTSLGERWEAMDTLGLALSLAPNLKPGAGRLQTGRAAA